MNPRQDIVLQSFLERQIYDGTELAARSDLFDFEPLGPNRYVMRFRCRSLVCSGPGRIEEADRCDVGVFFARDYLRVVRPAEVVTVLYPWNVFHPNILGPMACLGTIAPGTSVVDLAYSLYDLIRWALWASHDALNPDAAQWARHHSDRFPIDGRPMLRATSAAAGDRAALTENVT